LRLQTGPRKVGLPYAVNSVAQGPSASGHMASFDRRKSMDLLNGSNGTGRFLVQRSHKKRR